MPWAEQEGWDAYAAFMDRLVESGLIVLGGPLADDERIVHAIEAESEAAIRNTLAEDPWHDTHLRLERIDRWTIRLDSRR